MLMLLNNFVWVKEMGEKNQILCVKYVAIYWNLEYSILFLNVVEFEYTTS